MQPPEFPPPIKLLAWLKAWKFEPVELTAGGLPWYRRPGEVPVPWDEAPGQVTSELARENDRLTTENAKLKQVTPKPGWMTSEFLLNAGGVLAVGIAASQGQIQAIADSLGPQYGALAQVVITVVLAGAGMSYNAKRKADKALTAENVKQVATATEEKKL